MLLSTGFVVVGLELSAEGISTTVARIVAGTRALVGGTEYFVETPAFVAGLSFLCTGGALAILLLWSDRRRTRIGTVGRTCPGCGDETVRVRRTLSHRLFSHLVQERVTRRRCGTCGWSGLALKR